MVHFSFLFSWNCLLFTNLKIHILLQDLKKLTLLKMSQRQMLGVQRRLQREGIYYNRNTVSATERSVRMADRLALPTSDHGVTGSNPAGGEILLEPKRRFTAQSLWCSPFHRLEMTEILSKGRKTLTHTTIQQPKARILAVPVILGQIKNQSKWTNEPQQDKTIKLTCAPSEDSDQPAHPPSLVRVFTVGTTGS